MSSGITLASLSEFYIGSDGLKGAMGAGGRSFAVLYLLDMLDIPVPVGWSGMHESEVFRGG